MSLTTAEAVPQSTARPGPLALAMSDVLSGIAFWPLWVRLGWNDILQRYRRSMLGPFWLTASMAIMVVSLGLIYSKIFKTEINDFIPFLCVGLLAWGFISSVLADAGMLFTGAETYIKQIRLPYSLYVYRFIWSRIIIFGHNFVIYFGVLIYFQVSPGWNALLAIPGFIFLLINGALATTYLGMASARFRDIPQVINSFMQIIMFITPIFWKAEFIGHGSSVVMYNPFYHLVETIRAPLLGQVPTMDNYIAVGLITLLNFSIASWFFVRFRSRIAYWV